MYFSVLEIEINHHCNRTCWYCPNSVTERKEKGEMSQDLFLKLMDQLCSISYKGSISYQFYNEPLLSPNLEWFIETTRKHLPQNKLLLYTNGTLLDTDKFKKLLKSGLDEFVVTKHDQVGAFEFDETYQNLTLDEKQKVTFKNFTDINLTNRGGLVEAGPKKIPALLPCFIPEFLAVITLKGNMLPCFEDYHQELVMGNIADTHIKEIWNSPKYETFRSNLRKGLRHLEGPCKKCNRTEVLAP